MAEINRIQKMKKELPYGKFIFRDGGQVLFNRHYEPIIHRDQIDVDGVKTKIPSAEKQWFYDDSNPPWLDIRTYEKCRAVLWAFGGLKNARKRH